MIRISKVISEYLLQERNICNRNEIKHAAFLAGILMMMVMIVMMIMMMMMTRQWRCTLFFCCFYPSTVEQIFFSWEQMTNAKAAFVLYQHQSPDRKATLGKSLNWKLHQDFKPHFNLKMITTFSILYGKNPLYLEITLSIIKFLNFVEISHVFYMIS